MSAKDELAENLLLSKLTPEQQETYRTKNYFDVKGNLTRRTYRIFCQGRISNVKVLKRNGQPGHTYCFGLRSCWDWPDADSWLMQAMLISTREGKMLRTAPNALLASFLLLCTLIAAAGFVSMISALIAL